MSHEGFTAPARGLESAIANIWQDILGVERVGADDDFFESGGESLEAVRMLAAVEDVLLAQISFADFLDAPTVAGLAELVRREREAPSLLEPAIALVGVPAPEPQSGPAPCTYAQERLWFVDQMAGGIGAYNEHRGMRIRGELDISALERSLRDVVASHEALRTSFAARDEGVVQLVAPEMPLQIEQIDLSGHPDGEIEAQRLIDRMAGEPFDLARAPLVRALLVKLSEREHIFELVLHHIICDGWSHVVVLGELEARYRAYRDGTAGEIPPPRSQYPAYARRQRNELSGARLQAAIAPWVQRLAGAPEALELPTDHPRPSVPSYAGATYRHHLPAELAAGVRAFARHTRATPFSTVLAIYYLLLARYSRQEDIVVGATTSGRDRPELEDAVGLFANTVSLRCDLAGAPSFRELVARASETVLWAVAHEQAPFDQIVAQLDRPRDLSRHPVFQVFIAHVQKVPLLDEATERYDAYPTTARFDITLFVEETEGEQLALAWEYSRDLFEPETIERMARHFLMLLEGALVDPERPVAELRMLAADESDPRAALADTAPVALPSFPVACMHELFEHQAELRPEAPALSFEGETLSYAELNARANRLAHHLRSLGAGPETLVTLFLEPSIEMLVAILGVLKAGAAYVPVDPEYPAERAAFVLEDTAAPLLVTQAPLLARLPEHAAHAVCLDRDRDAIAACSASDPEHLATPENLAYIIYTSGSTGRPKGVQVEHRQIARLFTATDAWYGFGPSDVWPLLHSYAFDFSVWEIWGALAYGGHLVVSPLWTTRSAPALAQLIADYGVTVMNATPSLFVVVQEELLRVAERLALRFVVFGGEALQPAALRPWFERFGDHGARLVNMYGITETTVHVTYRPITAEDCTRDTSPIGVPIPDLSLHLLDPAGAPVAPGVPGELFVGGAGVARGYLNRPELNAERFIENPFGPGRLYRTGDVARVLADGELDFRGRIDDQVKIRGFRIELGEVQAALRDVPGVSDCAVVAAEAAPGDTRLAAYVVAEGESEETMRTRVTEHLAARLPEYMVPAAVMLLEQLPLTRNGKTDRKALPAPVWELRAQDGYAAPLTPTEQAIAEVWQGVLGVEQVGRDDNFFNLGGHSLLAARMATQVRKRCAVELSVRALFDHPTLAAFAAQVDSLSAPAIPEPAATPAPSAADEFPLSYQQQQLVFFDALEPGSVTYNAALTLRIAGRLDHDVLRRALNAVIERHEALRTVLVWDQDQGRQVVLEPRPAELELVDLRPLPAAEREAQLAHRLREHALRPFDLSSELMLRTTVFELADAEHVLLFQTHHVAFDAWAVEVFYRDLSELYSAALEGRPARLPELALRYGESARRQRQQLSGERLERELDFWRLHLAGAPAVLELPTDHPRPPVQTYEGTARTLALPSELAVAVHEACQTLQITPYMLLLGALATTLYRRTGQDDIVVGGPMANRDEPGLENLVGFFANTVVVRTRLAGNPTFAELLAGVRESVLASYEHQEVPLELVVEAVRPQRLPGVNPLFQLNFRVRVGEPAVLSLPGATASVEPVDLGLARFDLALELHVSDDAIEAEWAWNTALFEEATILGLAADFEAVLQQALANPDRRLLGFELREEAALASAPAPGRGALRGLRRVSGQ